MFSSWFGGQKKSIKQDFHLVKSCYSDAEFSWIQQQYNKAAGKEGKMTESKFKRLLDIQQDQNSELLILALYSTVKGVFSRKYKHDVKRSQQANAISFEDVLTAKMMCSKSSKSERDNFVNQIIKYAATQPTELSHETLGKQEIAVAQLFLDCATHYSRAMMPNTPLWSTQASSSTPDTRTILNTIHNIIQNPPATCTYASASSTNTDPITLLLTHLPSFPAAISHLFHALTPPPDPSNPQKSPHHPLVPRLYLNPPDNQPPDDQPPDQQLPDQQLPKLQQLLLTPLYALTLSHQLPEPARQQWQLLYSSAHHGHSFASLMGRVAGRGATLVLVKDTGGHVFGGFAEDAWDKCGHFYGSYNAFLFSLYPVLRTFTCTCVNENVQWCGQGFSELPNGIGFGGRVGYYGLFIDSSMEWGESRKVANFDNDQLSSEGKFSIDQVEVWLVQQSDDWLWQQQQQQQGGSVLNQNQEDQMIMQLAGTTQYRDNAR